MTQVEQWTKDLGGVTTLLAGLTGLFGALGNLLKPDWLPPWLREWLAGLPVGWQVALAVLGLSLCGAGGYLLWRRGRRCSRVLRPEGLRLDRARKEHLVGREDDLAYLLDLCRANTLVFLEGESGTGKSALVTAGLLPALHDDPGLLPVIVENWGRQDWIGAAVSATREALLECLPEDHREPFRNLNRSDVNGLESALRDLKASIRRTPLLVFDQFDDYQTAFREQFLPPGKPVWITPAALCKRNAFWRVIAGLLKSGTIHVLFVTRNDIGGGLDCVRFLAEPPRCVLPGVKRAPIAALLMNLAQTPAGGTPVIADPDAGWTRLAERIAQDLTRDRDWLLPQQLSIVLRSLSDLACLDVPSYERAGGAEGLEARFIQSELEAAESASGVKLALLRETLFSLVEPISQRKTILRPETGILEAWVQATGHDADAVRSALEKARERLVRVEVLRLRLDPETQAMRWQLDHDYLARGVVACVRKAAKWQILLDEAADAYDQAPLRGCWSALLGPGVLARLLRERLRWRPEVHFGMHRRYVALSGLRLLPAITVIAIAAFMVHIGREWNEAAELWKRLEFADSISEQEIQTLDQVRDAGSFARTFFNAEVFRTPSVAGKFLKQPHAVLHALVNLDPERGRALADRAWSALAVEEIPAEGDKRPKLAALLALAIVEPVATDVLMVRFVCAAVRLVKAINKEQLVIITRVIKLSKDRIRPDSMCPGFAADDSSLIRPRSGPPAGVGLLDALLAAMKSSTNSNQLAALGQAYAAVAAKLDEKGAREAVSALLAAMKSGRPDSRQLAALGQAYAAAAAKLDEKGRARR
ncbi:hypothetical protein [Plasticicumulans sp.]|uniref:nSTAND1 domain-containing NTPase n=1 Tax=Plasticicumulans sp. TaxID=2307179 RepID=UPI0039286F4B